MPLFQEWVNELYNGFVGMGAGYGPGNWPWATHSHAPCNCKDPSLVGNGFWPFSSFFDWQINVANPSPDKGFLPPIMSLNVGCGKPYGLNENEGIYNVNPEFLFVGFNPSRDLWKLPIRDHRRPSGLHDPNCGNFRNFNLASDIRANWTSYKGFASIGLLVKLFDRSQPPWTPIEDIGLWYEQFKSSYMIDIMPTKKAADANDARAAWQDNKSAHVNSAVPNPKIQPLSIDIFNLEIAQYQTFVLGPNNESFPKIICIGNDAFNILTSLRGSIVGIPCGTPIYKVRHYAHNGHNEMVFNLVQILNQLYGALSPLFGAKIGQFSKVVGNGYYDKW